MTVIDSGKGKLPDGPGYSWKLEDTDEKGCRVVVEIGEWGFIGSYPTILTSWEATAESKKLAAALLISIKTYRQ